MTNKKPKIVHFIFVLIIYNFTLSLIVYGTIFISDYYEFEYQGWSLIQWWVFYSILIFISGFFMFLIPSFVEFLEELSQRIIISVQVRYSTNVKKLEARLNELREDD